MISKGITTLAMSVLLLIILSSMSVFITRAKVAERRLMVNEIEARLVQAAAEQAIAEAIAQRHVLPNSPGLSQVLAHELGDIHYQVTIEPYGALTGVLQLTATANMASGARSRIRLALAERSVLNPQHREPSYPLLLAGENNRILGRLQLVTNSHHQPVASVWARGDLNVQGTLQTCYPSDYDDATQSCLQFLSQVEASEQQLAADMHLADVNFPADIVEYIFGYGAAQADNLAALASAVVAECSHIQRPGFYIVVGGSACQLDQVVSSPEAPVMLLIKDMPVIAQNPIQLYGLVMLAGSAEQSLSLTLPHGSELMGALIVGADNVSLNGDFSVRYDEGVLCLISDCRRTPGETPYRILSVLAGSWHDHE